MLYFGAAGVIWALDYLNGVGATAMKLDYANSLVDLAAKNRADMKLRGPQTNSYLMGDVGILLVQWRLSPSDALADQIFQAVESKHDEPGAGTYVGRAWNHVGCAFYASSRLAMSAGGKSTCEMLDSS